MKRQELHVVIGGGVAGCLSAIFRKRAGYQVVLLEAAQRSLEQMYAKLVAMCSQQVPGDTQRNLQIAPEYSDRTFKHVLGPIWLLTYGYRAKTYQVIVNGYTGAIAGRRPYSAFKIAAAILLAIVLGLIMLWVTGQQ